MVALLCSQLNEHDLALLRSERDTQVICQRPARGGMEPGDAAVRQARGYGQEGTQ